MAQPHRVLVIASFLLVYLGTLLAPGLPSLYIGSGEEASAALDLDIDNEIVLQGEAFILYANLTEQGTISIEIDDPNATPVYLKTVETDDEGYASIELKAGRNWPLGNYTVYASASTSAGEKNASLSFALKPKEPHDIRHPDFYITAQDIWLWCAGVDQNISSGEGDSSINWPESTDEMLLICARVHNKGDRKGNGALRLYINKRSTDTFVGEKNCSLETGESEVLTFPFPLQFMAEGKNSILVLVFIEDVTPEDKNPLDNQMAKSFTVFVITDDDSPDSLFPGPPPTLTVVSLSVVLAGAYLYTETGLYKFFSFLMFLFTRLTRKDIENDIREQTIRGMIYQHIKENPGVHYSSIQKTVGVANGTLCYHLDVLQKLRYVRCADMKGKKVYWSSDLVFPDKKRYPRDSYPLLNENQRRIVSALLSGADLSVKELLELTNLPRSTLNNTLQNMKLFGMIRKVGGLPSRYSLNRNYEEHYREYEMKLDNF